MNIFDQYGIKEVADVTLYSIHKKKDGSGDVYYVPALYLDTLKISTVEKTAENVWAEGGLGNARLICWDYGKTINVTLEDALCTPASLGLCWNGVLNADWKDADVKINTDVCCCRNPLTKISRTEKAFYPRQDREKAVISNLLPKLSKDTVDEGLGLLKISSVVDGTNIRGTGICHNHSYRWRMAIESAVQSIAVVPDRFFDVKGKSYPIDWNRKVSVASLPTYNNYKDAVIYKINSRAKCVVPPVAKIIFDNDVENKGEDDTILSLTCTGTTKTISLGKLFKENGYSILENGAITKNSECYIPYRSLSTRINGVKSDNQYTYTATNEKIYKITDSELKTSIMDAPVINYDIEVEGTLVSYLENAATTELFAESGGITDTLGSVEAVSEVTEIENGDYLAIIVDNNDNYYALIGTKSSESDSKNIIVTWAQPAIPVDTF